MGKNENDDRSLETYKGLSGRYLGAAKRVAALAGIDFRDYVDRQQAGDKWCYKCKEWFPIEDYGNDKSRIDGKSAICKMCRSIAGRASKLGITFWQAKYILNRKACDICGVKKDFHKMYIDHCHKTNKVRGLLCVACNSAIGQLKDSPELLKKAIDYIKAAGSNLGLDKIKAPRKQVCRNGHPYEANRVSVGTRNGIAKTTCKICLKASEKRRKPRGSKYWKKVNAKRKSKLAE